MTIASGTTGLETASGGFGRSFSIPKAKITGDEEYDSLEEEEAQTDWPYGVARVLSTEKELNLVDNGLEDNFLEATEMAGMVSSVIAV